MTSLADELQALSLGYPTAHRRMKSLPKATPGVSPERQLEAMVATRDFLLRLSDFRLSRKIPRNIRYEAAALFRQWPTEPVLREVFDAGLPRRDKESEPGQAA